MDEHAQLIPLVCLKCATPLPANPEEVVWRCGTCGQGLRLDEHKGLVPLEMYFSASIPSGGGGHPYWVADGQVQLQRDTYSGNNSPEAAAYWSSSRRFFIPAYTCNLPTLLSTGTGMLVQPPKLESGAPVPFDPVTLPLEDAPAAAEFIVVNIEAGRRDKLKSIGLQVALSTPVLWVLP